MDELKKEELETTQPLNEEVKDQIVEETSTIIPTESTVDDIDESEDDDYDSSGLLTGARYDNPDSADKFVDTKDGTVIDKENLTPFQIIKAIADQNGHKIKEPNKSCHHCYGRGYESMDLETQMPVPCRCLFRGRTAEEKENEQMWDHNRLNGKMNHDQRRRITKALAKQFKLQRKLMKNKVDSTEAVEPETEIVDKVLGQYVKLQSIKKTAKQLSMTLTAVNKIIDANRDKLETLKQTKE